MAKAASRNEVGRLVTIQVLADLTGQSRETVGRRLQILEPVRRASGPTPALFNSLLALPVAMGVIK